MSPFYTRSLWLFWQEGLKPVNSWPLTIHFKSLEWGEAKEKGGKEFMLCQSFDWSEVDIQIQVKVRISNTDFQYGVICPISERLRVGLQIYASNLIR